MKSVNRFDFIPGDRCAATPIIKLAYYHMFNVTHSSIPLL